MLDRADVKRERIEDRREARGETLSETDQDVAEERVGPCPKPSFPQNKLSGMEHSSGDLRWGLGGWQDLLRAFRPERS
jgi:hypothetical protein